MLCDSQPKFLCGSLPLLKKYIPNFVKIWDHGYVSSFLLSSISIEENIGFANIFDLHVLGCPEHDLTLSEK